MITVLGGGGGGGGKVSFCVYEIFCCDKTIVNTFHPH